MRNNRHNAPGGGRSLGRVGALGIVLAGALTAAVLSVAVRVPPPPVDYSEIPQVEVGSEAPRAKERRSSRPATATRRETRRESRRRDRARRRHTRRERRASGSAIPVRWDGGGSVSEAPAETGPTGGGSPPVTPQGGGAPPAPRGIARDRGTPAPGEELAAPRQSPAPAPAPAPVEAEPADDDDDDYDDDDDGAPGAAPAVNAPTPEADDDDGADG
jgi:hypothetical protein